MTDDEYKIFLEAQKDEINKYKWIESEKANRDLGVQACLDWIAKFAKDFRNNWGAYKQDKHI